MSAYDTSHGKGYLSRVFIVTVTFENNDEYRFALKIPTMEYVKESANNFDGETVSNYYNITFKNFRFI